MNKRLQFTAKIVKGDGNKITVVASDETLDRHGDVLKIEDWDLSHFVKAPRMLVDHDHRVEKIVGRWENPRIENRQLLLDANFHDITELSRAVHQMVIEDHLNSVSIGAIYNAPESDGQRGKMELIETSWVTVGANPSALVVSRALELKEATESDEDVAKVKTFLDVKDEAPVTDEKDVEIAKLKAELVESEDVIKTLEGILEKRNQALKNAETKLRKLAVTKLLMAEIAKSVNQANFVMKD